MIGARVGNWYVEAEVGRGPLGTVYRARDFHDPDRRAAVKVFTDPVARDPAFLQRFPGEMLALQRLDYPNIARYFDSGTHAGHAYVAAELVDGTDAATLLEAGRRPWREVLNLAVQAARALKHGHNRNLLHRDLKPAHLMLTPDGTLKLLGYGLAKVATPPLAAVPVIGSAAYLPPETASGKPPTRRSDFYSLGGVLYTLLTARPPFAAATVVELTHKQCYALPERPGMLVPDLPPELDEFVCALLAKDPARRPATAQAVLDELERIRGKLERKGEPVDWPAKLQPDTAEMPALPASLAGSPEREDAEPIPPPWFLRPWVLAPAFAAVMLATLGLFAALGGDSDEDVLKQAVADGAKVAAKSDAERGYRRGLGLAQAGDADGARRVWQAVVTAFGPVESEAHWVGLAKAGLSALDRRGRTPRLPGRTALDAALAHAKALAATDPPAAEATFRALEELTRDDPVAAELIRAAKNGK
jgi:hypothetical protein